MRVVPVKFHLHKRRKNEILLYTAAAEIHKYNNKYTTTSTTLQRALEHHEEIICIHENVPNELMLQAFTADTTAAGENTLNYRKAMKAPDSDKFEEEMEAEIKRFIDKETFDTLGTQFLDSKKS